ncbi:MAG TPA: hypothetical protein ENI80_03515 [Acidiferrobacteraceae bacterium]|nr:hypothetical protein [Acidiferrobacteraceae bacterium]
MKATFGIVSIVIVGSLILLLAAGMYGKDIVKQSLKNPFANLGNICLEAHKTELRDPHSAYIVETRTTKNKVTIEYRSKNGLGAYVAGHLYCLLNADGSIDESDLLNQRVKRLTK